MPREIEAKFRVGDPDRLRGRLRELGAARVSQCREANSIYDFPDGRLRSAGSAVRLRRLFDPRDGSPLGASLAYKGPREPGPIKVREEIETGVTDADALAVILHRLGLAITVQYQKLRETWRLGDVEVVLDELPRLGWFAEIEARTPEAVESARAAIGLSASTIEPHSYVALAVQTGDRGADGVFSLCF